MIEYTAYVIENNVPEDQLPQLFAEKNITIDTNYISEVLKLQELYLQIRQIYSNETKVKQFVKALKKSALLDRIQTFTGFPPVFIKFYFKFLELIDHSQNLPKESLRSRVVKHLINVDWYRQIIKYDYYFTNTLFFKIESVGGDRGFLTSQGQYLVYINENKVLISIERSQRTFVFPVNINYVCLLIGDKFLFTSEYGKDMFLLDLKTEEIKVIPLDEDIKQVSNLALLNKDKVVVTTYTTYSKVYILDLQTFELLNRIEAGARHDGLVILPYPIKDNIQIVTLNDNEEETEISFCNPLRSEPVKVITIPHDPEKHQRSLTLFNNKLVAQYGSGLLLFMDWDGENMITVNEHDDPEAFDDDLISDIFATNQLVVLFKDFLRYYNEEGKIVKEIDVGGAERIFKLPNNNILATNRKGPRRFIRVYTQQGSYEYEIIEIIEDSYPAYYRDMTVTSDGKFAFTHANKDLVIYK